MQMDCILKRNWIRPQKRIGQAGNIEDGIPWFRNLNNCRMSTTKEGAKRRVGKEEWEQDKGKEEEE